MTSTGIMGLFKAGWTTIKVREAKILDKHLDGAYASAAK
jgi:hypothetical protein